MESLLLEEPLEKSLKQENIILLPRRYPEELVEPSSEDEREIPINWRDDQLVTKFNEAIKIANRLRTSYLSERRRLMPPPLFTRTAKMPGFNIDYRAYTLCDLGVYKAIAPEIIKEGGVGMEIVTAYVPEDDSDPPTMTLNGTLFYVSLNIRNHPGKKSICKPGRTYVYTGSEDKILRFMDNGSMNPEKVQRLLRPIQKLEGKRINPNKVLKRVMSLCDLLQKSSLNINQRQS